MLRILADTSPYWQQGPFTPQGPVAERMHDVFVPLFIVSCLVFFGVSGVILYAAFRFRRRSDDEEPVQVHGNNRLEIAWTILPFAILIALFINTAVNMPFINNVPAAADTTASRMNICTQGQQFNWSYFYYNEGNYTDGNACDGKKRRDQASDRVTYAPVNKTGVVTSPKLIIPVGRPVKLSIVSADVNHSFYIPSVGGQVNAIPGQTNDLWFQIDKAGVYHGACTELCGDNHAGMLIEIDAMDQKQYDDWFNKAKQSAQPKAGAAPSPSPGSGG